MTSQAQNTHKMATLVSGIFWHHCCRKRRHIIHRYVNDLYMSFIFVVKADCLFCLFSAVLSSPAVSWYPQSHSPCLSCSKSPPQYGFYHQTGHAQFLTIFVPQIQLLMVTPLEWSLLSNCSLSLCLLVVLSTNSTIGPKTIINPSLCTFKVPYPDCCSEYQADWFEPNILKQFTAWVKINSVHRNQGTRGPV